MSERTTGSRWLTTSFANSGRIAGCGVLYDDYSEMSGNRDYEKHEAVRFPNDKKDPRSLNGEVIIVQKGRNNG